MDIEIDSSSRCSRQCHPVVLRQNSSTSTRQPSNDPNLLGVLPASWRPRGFVE